MKKYLVILLAGLLLLGLCACGSKRGADGSDTLASSANAAADNQPTAATPSTTGNGGTSSSESAENPVPTVLNTMEYTLYTNIFYNKTGDDYIGQTITKEGTFTTIRDRFNDVTRYYVWGYNDQTKCCDWQWEFVPKDPASLPSNGSYVKMTGTFEKSSDALDGYWFVDAELKVQTVYEGPACDVDMGTMSATLERVQLINMQVYPQDFEGEIIRAYGRVAGANSLEHPYYDGAWTQDFLANGEVPAIGKVVTVTGVWTDGVIKGATVRLTDYY